MVKVVGEGGLEPPKPEGERLLDGMDSNHHNTNVKQVLNLHWISILRSANEPPSKSIC